MCDEWLSSFTKFFEYMGAKPSGTSLDRVDVNGNYEPGNVRWADRKTQSLNRRKKTSHRQLALVVEERDLWKARAIELGWTE